MKINSTTINSFPFTIRPLSDEDGGGFMIEYADLSGCVSDGDTPEDAVAHGRAAVRAYLLSCAKHGDPIPKPGQASGNGGSACLAVSTPASSLGRDRRA